MLSLPPAFNLSHDQTLQFNLLFANEKGKLFYWTLILAHSSCTLCTY
ncbi:hypothetical protein AO385_1844 [Moraxella catarrhalis]|uniref:Uncharacterized protein n=1 Tax=Moraxella catarrhalis TaxID=480 RepID=A0A198UGX8_MORCA|nr:hypothetical protein AO384_1206 [Moraxella catarrhalis]OAU95798.1 hypothetical protein AO384_1156 [Moraxella catarrhalis]OAU96391.1 hypothetical protein AO385_1844 [Moraxella catarrhalis]OAU97856.1 hypothetical protein AO383_0807 [Moraxella catarrhalis]